MNHSIVIRYNWDERDESKWLFWLEKKLRALGCEVSVEPLPEFAQSETAAVVRDICRTHGVLGKDTFVVPHDPGCLTLMKYCERLIRSGKDDPTLLVAAVPARGAGTAPSSAARLSAAKAVAVNDENFLSDDSLDDTLHAVEVKLVVVYGGVLPEAHPDVTPLLSTTHREDSLTSRVRRFFGF